MKYLPDVTNSVYTFLFVRRQIEWQTIHVLAKYKEIWSKQNRLQAQVVDSDRNGKTIKVEKSSLPLLMQKPLRRKFCAKSYATTEIKLSGLNLVKLYISFPLNFFLWGWRGGDQFFFFASLPSWRARRIFFVPLLILFFLLNQKYSKDNLFSYLVV